MQSRRTLVESQLRKIVRGLIWELVEPRGNLNPRGMNYVHDLMDVLGPLVEFSKEYEVERPTYDRIIKSIREVVVGFVEDGKEIIDAVVEDLGPDANPEKLAAEISSDFTKRLSAAAKTRYDANVAMKGNRGVRRREAENLILDKVINDILKGVTEVIDENEKQGVEDMAQNWQDLHKNFKPVKERDVGERVKVGLEDKYEALEWTFGFASALNDQSFLDDVYEHLFGGNGETGLFNRKDKHDATGKDVDTQMTMMTQRALTTARKPLKPRPTPGPARFDNKGNQIR